MISTYQRLKRQRDAGEISGFTLIELLIVIVVLGILAAVVIFALGGITGKSAVAACQADGATVSTAISAYNAQNAGTPLTSGNYIAQLVTSTTDGGPYVQSWPSNLPHYAFQVATVGTAAVLQVSTGNTFAAGKYTKTAAAGSLVAAGGTPATDIVGTAATAPWLAYAGPTTCTGVA